VKEEQLQSQLCRNLTIDNKYDIVTLCHRHDAFQSVLPYSVDLRRFERGFRAEERQICADDGSLVT
jgi:hypothetical protein